MKNESALSQYIERKNYLRGFFKKAPFDVANLSQADIAEIKGDLECDLSPENLHCDGEISRAQAQEKLRFYKQVERELDSIAQSQKVH